MTDTLNQLAAALAGRYRMEGELGSGGMATVYLAEDLKHRRRVAVKVLHPGLAQAVGAERFLREIEIAARLRHAHILPLYDSGSVANAAGADLLYYIMPYVDGETLRARMDRERQLPVDEALTLAREVADALSYAHAQGVIHRDIKPENILLEAGHAIVADFGIARAIAGAGETSSLTATGTSVGTPAYMSPEQAAGDPELDGRSDLYSLGCVLYEMLAGQPPFTGPTVESIVRQHVTAVPPPVTQLRPSVPAALAETIARALAKNPADRFNPVAQFAGALAASAAASPVPAAASGAARAHPRRWPLAAALVTVVVIAAAALVLFRPDAAIARDEPRSLAVLPFETLGADSVADPFALGLHAELITQLGKLGAIQVTSRGSTLEYRGSDKSDRTIAAELGVRHLLTGSIQRAGSQLRFTIALDDAASGEQRWAERYDRELTAENLFQIQADIARQVAAALQVQLTPAQQTALGEPMTTNLAALDRYYGVLPLWDARGVAGNDTAVVRMLEEAVELDPQFAAAWSLLVQARGWLLRSGLAHDTIPAARALAQVAELAPGSLEHRLAAGYYHYYARADFPEALRHLREADRIVPGSSEIMIATALVLRRMARWDESESYLRRAIAVDPRNPRAAADLGDSYRLQRRGREAADLISRAHVLAPASVGYAGDLLLVRLFVQGDTAAARRLMDSTESGLPADLRGTPRGLLAAYRRDWPAAAAFLASGRDVFITDMNSRLLILAVVHRAAGNAAAMRQAAAGMLEVAEERVAEIGMQGGHDPFGSGALAELHAAAAMVLLGDTAAGVARAEAASRQLTPERDALDGAIAQELLAATYALAGRRQEAIGQLGQLAARPARLGAGALRYDPVWDDLRGEPEFVRILSRVEAATR